VLAVAAEPESRPADAATESTATESADAAPPPQ
jgi:hypothetical protein